jgi:outer membrane protein OmpA-like peptidoglycan-associated protein
MDPGVVPTGGVVLAAVALVCVLPSLTGCTNGGGSGSANGASSKAAVGPANPGSTDHGDSDDGVGKTKKAALAAAVLPVAARAEPAGIAGMMSSLLGMMPGSDDKGAAKGYLTASGNLKLAEPKPMPFRLIVNDVPVSLPAWHVKGRFGEGDEAVDVEWYILDDSDNPLSLRFAFGKEQLEIVRIEFPVENEAKALEAVLTDTKRAVLYGTYFDFNSATIKPQSEAVLRTIVDVMKKDPEWVLVVEGHTDNIGGDVRNQDLSSRRAASVKAALVERGVSADRLNTAGYGASVPRETNATLAGRARKPARRVDTPMSDTNTYSKTLQLEDLCDLRS